MRKDLVAILVKLETTIQELEVIQVALVKNASNPAAVRTLARKMKALL